MHENDEKQKKWNQEMADFVVTLVENHSKQEHVVDFINQRMT